MSLKPVDTIVNLKQRKRELFREWLNEQLQHLNLSSPTITELALKSYQIGYSDAILETGSKLGEFLNNELEEEDKTVSVKLMWKTKQYL